MGNLLTGQLYVALDFFPNAGVSQPVPPVAAGDPLQLPTMPNSLDELQSQIGEIAVKLNKVPYEQIGSDLQKTMASLERTLGNAEQLVKTLNNDVSPQITAAMKDVRRTLETASKTLDQAGKTMATAGRAIAEDAPLQQDLRHTLQEISRSAASLRVLTDYLEQHPESLLRGKPRDGR
jgi:paraquat-inducible protein B